MGLRASKINWITIGVLNICKRLNSNNQSIVVLRTVAALITLKIADTVVEQVIARHSAEELRLKKAAAVLLVLPLPISRRKTHL
jgi:hypothetical protein